MSKPLRFFTHFVNLRFMLDLCQMHFVHQMILFVGLLHKDDFFGTVVKKES